LLNHNDGPATVMLPHRYTDALAGVPVGPVLSLNPWQVHILRE
jgi:hypothetical protein